MVMIHEHVHIVLDTELYVGHSEVLNESRYDKGNS